MNIARTVTEAPASPAVTASLGASPKVLLAVLLVVLLVLLLLLLLLLLVVLDALLLVAVKVLDVACSLLAAGCGTRTVKAPGNFQESPNKPLPKPPWM